MTRHHVFLPSACRCRVSGAEHLEERGTRRAHAQKSAAVTLFRTDDLSWRAVLCRGREWFGWQDTTVHGRILQRNAQRNADRQSRRRRRCFRLSVHPSPSVSYPYPSIILHYMYSFRQPWCRCCYLPWRLIAKQSGGGLIMDKGCHVIDRIDYLFGPHP